MHLDALDALVALPTWACCAACKHREVVEDSELVNLAHAKKMKAMGKRLGLDGDKFEEVGRWLKVSWKEPRCKVSKKLCFPDDVWHNCYLVNSKQKDNKEENWWE